MNDEGRAIATAIYVVWAVASVIVWGHDLRSAWTYHRTWRDDRSRREFIDSAGLFTVALGSFVSLFVLVFGQSVAGFRGFAIAIALGSFLVVGVMRWTLARRQRRVGRYGRRIGDRA